MLSKTLTHEEKKKFIVESLEKKMTLEAIGLKLGVTKQRVYQLMSRYGIQTPEKNKHGYWKDKPHELKWLNRVLCSRGIDRQSKSDIVDHALKNYKEMFPEYCPILGNKLVYGEENVRTDNSASIDRIDSDKPYVLGNIQVICWRANRIKNDSTVEELGKIYKYMLQKNNKDVNL
jgi:hypothetical protein